MLNKNDVILFQGDSVTDVGRNRADINNMGFGYPLYISSLLNAWYPELELKFINKGVSGDRVKDLKARWTRDCIELKPTVVSILIGINDTWRRYDSGDPTSAEAYKENYDFILNRVKEELDAEIVIIEPFCLPYPSDRKDWRVDLDPKINAARELAAKYKATYIPMDGILAAKAIENNSQYWLPDGVHPSSTGHALIATEWIDRMGM